MNEKDKELLASIDQMIEDAPKLGLCSISFRTLKDEVERLIGERNATVNPEIQRIKIANDPFSLVLRAAENLYPGTEADIQFNPNMKYHKFLFFRFGKCGCTTFPDDGGIPLIDISTHIPFTAMAEILAHELAHVVTGSGQGHNQAWRDAFSAIHHEYNKLVESQMNN